MSRMRNNSNLPIPDCREEHGRDSSPSALSHTSGVALEWDPSADVGTQVPSNTPIHQPKRRDIHSGDLSGLEQMVMALNYGFDLKPYVKESRTRRFGIDPHTSNSHSEGSNSSYRTCTETEQDAVDANSTSVETEQDVVDVTSTSVGLTSISSDWQTSGLTRSEIAYKSKKDVSTTRGSTISSSLLWVEVKPEVESSVNKTNDGEDSCQESMLDKKSIAVQASMKTSGKESCTSTRQNSRKHVKTQSTQIRESSKPRRCIPCCDNQRHDPRCCTINIPSTSANHCQQYYVPVQCHCHAMSIQGSGSGRSLGSQPNTEYRGVSSAVSRSNSSSSDITPTCATLERLIGEDLAALQNYGYEALEQHRSSLVRKIRKEFQHLEKLNKMLMDKKKLQPRSVSSMEPSSSSDTKDEGNKTGRSRIPPPTSSTSNSNSKSTSKSDNVYAKTSRLTQSNQMRHKSAESEIKEGDVRSNNLSGGSRPSVRYFVPFHYTPNYMQQPPTVPNQNRAERFGEKAGTSTSAQNSDGCWNNYESSKENVRPRSDGFQAPLGQQFEQNQGEYVMFENEFVQISLQQAFQQFRPNVLANVQAREHIVNNLKREREARGEIKRDYFRQRENLLSPNDSLNQVLPNNEPRLMTFRKMKELTEKKFKKLPEVREKENLRKMEEEKKLNRILSHVFSRKLRQHSIKGEMNIPHSKTLIRH